MKLPAKTKSIRLRDVGKLNPRGWEQPIMHGYQMVCCDCGLVHGMDFRVLFDKKGKPHVQFRANRITRLTARWRKQQRITVRFRPRGNREKGTGK
jgi:hypothetical protein